jgi:TonB family protein
VEEFRGSGTYTTPFYIYSAKTRQTTNTTLRVDTRQKTAILVQPLVGFKTKVNLSGPSTAMTKGISRVTAIVERQVAGFHGMTARDALTEQKLAVAKMLDGADAFQHGETSGEQLPVVSSPAGMQIPRVLKSVPARYTPEALRAGVKGLVTISFVVDTGGHPTDIRVLKSLGMGLDEEAINAVSQYRFTPAMETLTGKLRRYAMTLEVNFQPH